MCKICNKVVNVGISRVIEMDSHLIFSCLIMRHIVTQTNCSKTGDAMLTVDDTESSQHVY